jgi:hypothetical protein
VWLACGLPVASPDAHPRPRGLRLLLAALAGLVLAFGGACGVGPTDLSLLAVSAHQTVSPDDARGHVPVPAATEVAQPTRRRLVRRAGSLRRRLVARLRRSGATWSAGVVLRRGPPPLRGPPALVS